MPLFDFGTANFEAPEGKKNSFFIGVDREEGKPQPNKFSTEGDEVVNINPIALLFAGAPVVLVTGVILSLFLLAPGTQTPFKFLDGFYPPRVAEVKMLQAKKEKADAEAKAAADAAKKAAEEKAKAAEAEATKAAAAAPAAKK